MAEAAGTSGVGGSGTAGWIQSLGKTAVQKIGYQVLNWIMKSVGSSEAVPGANKEATSQKDFMSKIKDGVNLVKLANVMQPGAITNFFDKPENDEQKSTNLSSFVNFAKTMGGVSGGNLFKPDEVVKGKGFTGVLSTLTDLGSNATKNFGKEGLDTQSLMNIATQEAGKGFLSNLMGKVFKK